RQGQAGTADQRWLPHVFLRSSACATRRSPGQYRPRPRPVQGDRQLPPAPAPGRSTVRCSRLHMTSFPLTARSIQSFTEGFDAVVANVATVVQGKDDAIRLALLCLVAEGHLLIEDVPGVGKTS